MIEIENIARYHWIGHQRITILDNLNLHILPGESCSVQGPSGCGKSSLLGILGLLDQADKGRYRFMGHEVLAAPENMKAQLRNQHIGFVFQNFNLLPALSALDNVAFPLRYSRVSLAGARSRAGKLLVQLGLEDRQFHRPHELSGGQRQRVAIARALINNPSLILADEPTGNLDAENAEAVLQLLLTLNHQGVTLVVVTHDAGISARMSKQLILQDRKIHTIS